MESYGNLIQPVRGQLLMKQSTRETAWAVLQAVRTTNTPQQALRKLPGLLQFIALLPDSNRGPMPPRPR